MNIKKLNGSDYEVYMLHHLKEVCVFLGELKYYPIYNNENATLPYLYHFSYKDGIHIYW